MVRSTCCKELVSALIEVPRTKQPVCARCLRLIQGMLGVWDVLIARTDRREGPCDA